MMEEPGQGRSLQIGLLEGLRLAETESRPRIASQCREEPASPDSSPHALACNRSQEAGQRCVEQDRPGACIGSKQRLSENIRGVARLHDDRLLWAERAA